MMQPAAEAGLIPQNPSPALRPLRALPIEEVDAPTALDAVILRLAADRLRDLRDEGLTLAYVARMYGVEAVEMEALESELLPSRTR